MEIRLCSIAGSIWLQSLEAEQRRSSVEVPRNLGLTFMNALKAGLGRFDRVSDLMASGPAGLVLAKAGVSFASADFVSSVSHAIACVAEYDHAQSFDAADEIDSFVFGIGTYREGVPEILRRYGVYSVIKYSLADQIATWIQKVSRDEFSAEVEDMHGSENLASYLAAMSDLGNLFASVRVHQCDLCCV